MREERERGLKEGRRQDTCDTKTEVGEVLGVGSLSGDGVREKGERRYGRRREKGEVGRRVD